MCGICGFNWDDQKLIKDMAYVIGHRGPDQEGYFTDKSVSLGHKRLSIIDLSEKGRQPMSNEDHSIFIVFNGEIYNFQEIKRKLEKKGHKFSSNTDTEVIIHAYEEYGYNCLKLFNGMFAFAIWDSNKKELFLARDRIGIKPLYYFHQKGKFLFGSEIKAILQYNGIKREINKSCLKQIIYYAYPIRGETLLRHINELEPAHYLVCKEGKIKIKKYWDFKINEVNKSEGYFVNKLEELLFKSIKRRLISDVPLGLALSGGIDSSTVVAIATKLSDRPIKTFTLGFGCNNDEFDKARIVAEHCSTDHTEVHLNFKDFANTIPKTIWHLEIPSPRPAMVPLYLLFSEIRKNLTVSLAGEGADELFAGYNRYDAYTNLPPENSIQDKEFYNNLKSKINMPLKNKIEYVSSGVFNKDKEEFFNSDITQVPKDLDINKLFGKSLVNTANDGSQLNSTLRYEVKTIIPYFHCNKLDKMSMASSHEVRVPYLDHEIVEFAFTVPAKYKFYGLDKKILLQKVAKSLLPKEIAKRRKLPLVVPLTDFFENEFVSFANKILSETNLQKRPYYKIPRIRKLVEDTKNKKKLKDKNRVTSDNAYRQLLFLTNLELWIKLFIESSNLRRPELSINSYL